MKIFLDFDDCLFDTVLVHGEFWLDLRKIYERGGWNVEMIEKTADEFSDASFDGKPNTYSIEKHLVALNRYQPSEHYEAVKQECHDFMHELDRYLFPDVMLFLKGFLKQDLFIVTFGDPGFQKGKIFGSHIESCVQDILVSEGKPKMELIREYALKHDFIQTENMVFVDDKEKYFERMKENERNIITVLMDRRGIFEKNSADYRVADCVELATVLQKLTKESFSETDSC